MSLLNTGFGKALFLSLILIAAVFAATPKSAQAQDATWNVTFSFKETARGNQQGYEYAVDHDASGKATLKVSEDGVITGSGSGTTKASAQTFTEYGTCTGQGTFSATFSVGGSFDKSTGKAQLRLSGVSPQSTPIKITCPNGAEDQGDLYLPFDTCGKSIPLTLANGVSEKGVFTASRSECGEDVTNGWSASVTGSQKPTITITVAKPELNSSSDPKTSVTLKVTNEDGTPAKNAKVDVKVCTAVGSKDTDGHLHDKRKDRCDPGRPAGTIKDAKGGKESSKLTVTTDQTGSVSLTYKAATDSSKKYYISGKDFIVAEMGDAKAESSIVTKVPNLEPMPGSSGGAGSPNYIFESGKHDNLFYGTRETNQSIKSIADAFAKKQVDCKNGCKITDDKGNTKQVKTNSKPVPLKITAMSLPWGGLNDIDGNWSPPHKTHNSGKELDIGFGNLGGCKNGVPSDLILILRSVIVSKENTNFASWANANEGGDMAKTCAAASPHFHVNFKS